MPAPALTNEGSASAAREAVLVTGAAGGLGRLVVERLRERGYEVLGWDAHPSPGIVAVDVSDAEDVHVAAHELPPLAGVVHCAGITNCVSLAASDPAEFARVIAVNLLGTFHVAQATFARLQQGSGVFIGIGSVQGSTGFRDRAAYGASKAGVASLVRSMAVEWAPAGVRAICVSPGYTNVGMSAQSALPPAVAARIPNGRLVDGDEVVDVISFVLSRAAVAISGIEIPVDNGFISYGGI